MKYTLILLLTLSLNAFAGWTPPTPPNQGGSGDSNSEAKATSTNFNTNLNNAHSSSNSSSSQGQQQGQLQGQIANGGNQHQTAKSKVKDSGNSSQSQASNSKGGNSANEYSNSYNSEATKATAASAASISTAGCQVGSSGQTKNGGFSAITDSPLCVQTIVIDIERQGLKNSVVGSDEWNEHIAEIDKREEMIRDYADSTYELGKASQQAAHAGQIVFWLGLIKAILFGA